MDEILHRLVQRYLNGKTITILEFNRAVDNDFFLGRTVVSSSELDKVRDCYKYFFLENTGIIVQFTAEAIIKYG
jgi:hypothetical protein